MWKFIANLMKPPKRTKLAHVNTLENFVHLLKTCNKIVVLSGAGVSVSCGIPDFRSENGMYSYISKEYPDLPDPQAMFDINYFKKNPRPFFKFAKEYYPGQFEPSPSHKFIKVLEEKNKLLRNYTQNVDGLEHSAGIRNVIFCHGSCATATCTECGYRLESSVIKEDVFNDKIPYCPICPAELKVRGIMKPDVIFFGEEMPDEFRNAAVHDKDVCDLFIVMGSSLNVQPVAMIPSFIPAHIPQILINRELLSNFNFDVELLGDCDVVIGELCSRLDKEWDIDETIPRQHLKEVIPSEDEVIHHRDTSRSVSKKLPDESYWYFPMNRYIFPGAEIRKDDFPSTFTDFDSDSLPKVLTTELPVNSKSGESKPSGVQNDSPTSSEKNSNRTKDSSKASACSLI